MTFNKKSLTNQLFDIVYNLKETLKDGKVKKWVVGGIIVYGAPAIYRFVTKNPILPYIPLIETPSEYIPNNLPEKLIVNSIAPGGVGAVIGETFINKIEKNKTSGWRKYLSRVGGSLVTTGTWAGIQYLGYTISDIFKYQWSSRENPFEPPNIYPFNLLIAFAVAPLTPYVVNWVKTKINKLKPYLISRKKVNRNNKTRNNK